MGEHKARAKAPGPNYESQIRNPKFETNPNDQKAQNSKRSHFGFFDFGFEGFGLFRISCFGFRILIRDS
jgi:hypothetical protein